MAGKFVFEENTFTSATKSLSDGGTVIVEAEAYVLTASGVGIALDASPWTVKVDGTIRGDDGGIVFASNIAGPTVPNSKLAVGTDASIIGTGGGSSGVIMGMPVDIANAGRIEGDKAGILAGFFGTTTSKGFTITNKADASIIGDVGIDNTALSPTMTVKNAGYIAGTGGTAITWAGAVAIVNDGFINGDLISLSPMGTDLCTITNKGRLEGDTVLADGNDVFKNSGLVFGTVDLQEGNNKAVNSGSITDTLTAGSGNDTLINSGGISGAVDLGAGKNTVTNSGRIDSLTLGMNDDLVTNSGDIDAGLTLGGGNDMLANGGTIDGTVAFGSGDDVLKNTKRINDDVFMGGGNNTVTNSGQILATLHLGSGNDTVKNTGFIFEVELGDGTNSLTNSGSIGDLIGGSGNDIVKSTGDTSNVNLKGGDDTFIGGADEENVVDDIGSDTYNLGGGNDQLSLVFGVDTADGGAGLDRVTLSVANPCRINLDTKEVDLGGQTLNANSAFSTGIAATIKNFEWATGGSNDDLINGNAAANFLIGSGGKDILAGGLGSDRLIGGADDDAFVYFQTKDSGITQATRDVIADFQGAGAAGGDKIDLSLIDTDSKMAGDQGFLWRGNNNAFLLDGSAQLRAVTQAEETVIQGDVNGDGKVDFSIAVTGIMSFDGGDFAL